MLFKDSRPSQYFTSIFKYTAEIIILPMTNTMGIYN